MKSLVILAGGKSSRMGQDKVLLQYDGRSFIERIYENALGVFERIIISTDSCKHAETIKKLPLFAGRKIETVTDNYNAFGPIGAIASVFENSDVERFSIISVDIPLADMNVLSALYDVCEKKAVFLKIGEKKAEPLIAAYDRSSYEDIKAALEAGLYKVRLAVENDKLDIITDAQLAERFDILQDVDFEKSFDNFNTPQEFERLIEQQRR